jgi:selenocysteine-specific elongation factor
MASLAAEEVELLLADTTLREARVFPVSSVTGAGIEELRAALRALAREARPRTSRAGPPRLSIDRVFAMKGFGTVVTGTLLGSAMAVGEPVELQPSGKTGRIRGLQSHGVARDRIEPGTRCAVNLQGIDVADVSRGEVLSRPDALSATSSADVELGWLPSAPTADGTVSIEFLSGTAERRAHLAPIGRATIEPGSKSFARLHIDDSPIALLPGDRFIARGFARDQGTGGTVGGGIVLDIAPPHRRRSDPALLAELEILAHRESVADVRERIRRAGFRGVEIAALARELGLEKPAMETIVDRLTAEGEIERAGIALCIDRGALSRMGESLLAGLEAFHADQPLRPGMPRRALRGRLPDNVRPEGGDLVLARLEAAGEIEIDGDLVRRRGFGPTLDAESREKIDRILEEARTAALEPPSPRDWAERLGITRERFRDLVAHLERDGQLVRRQGPFLARENFGPEFGYGLFLDEARTRSAQAYAGIPQLSLAVEPPGPERAVGLDGSVMPMAGRHRHESGSDGKRYGRVGRRRRCAQLLELVPSPDVDFAVRAQTDGMLVARLGQQPGLRFVYGRYESVGG